MRLGPEEFSPSGKRLRSQILQIHASTKGRVRKFLRLQIQNPCVRKFCVRKFMRLQVLTPASSCPASENTLRLGKKFQKKISDTISIESCAWNSRENLEKNLVIPELLCDRKKFQ